MDLCQTRRGEMVKLEYLSPDRVELHYRIPLAEVVVDFFDQLKSRSQGYASLDYEPADYARANLVKVDILLNGVVADAFSTIVHRDRAYDWAAPVRQLRRNPAAAVRRLSRPPSAEDQLETASAKRKDAQVLRRRHHLQAQAPREAEGKKKMKSIGRVGPQEAHALPRGLTTT
jgi:GTP-binding protein LepA